MKLRTSAFLLYYSLIIEGSSRPLSLISFGGLIFTFKLISKFIKLIWEKEGNREEIILLWELLAHQHQTFPQFVLMGDDLYSRAL